MENHPIPQDITGFQFKLIGNMTVRQFVYLAVGGVLAWIFFFFLHLPTLIKLPLSIISLSAGAALAFVPIDGRPMDVMLRNFFRALISPTQFVYKKEGGSLETASYSLPKTQNQIPPPHVAVGVLQTPPPAPIVIQAPVQAAPIQTPTPPPPPAPTPVPIEPTPVPAVMQSVSMQPVMPPPPPSPTPISVAFEEPVKTPEQDKEKARQEEIDRKEKEFLQKQIEELQKQLEESKAKEVAPPPPPAPAPAAPAQAQQDLEKQLIESNRQKEALEKQILEINAKSTQANTQAFKPAVAKPLTATERVRSVPSGMEKAVGLPSAPEAPNLVTGIVKDPRGNPLANILVEIKDQDSNPVRAFKTNGLGKFASATPLSNGKYLISFEDPGEKNKFDAVQIELIGAIVMPLEIISVDPREELRRELFN
jgi:hypothetical protein